MVQKIAPHYSTTTHLIASDAAAMTGASACFSDLKLANLFSPDSRIGNNNGRKLQRLIPWD